jgi:hypothetical protein
MPFGVILKKPPPANADGGFIHIGRFLLAIVVSLW